jgi:hypothetical protein
VTPEETEIVSKVTAKLQNLNPKTTAVLLDDKGVELGRSTGNPDLNLYTGGIGMAVTRSGVVNRCDIYKNNMFYLRVNITPTTACIGQIFTVSIV